MAAEALKAGRGLELRPLRLADARALFAQVDANRARLRRWLPWPDANRGPEDSRTYILRMRAQAKAGIGQSYGLWWKDRLVGVAGFNWIDRPNRSGALGYWLAREAEGRGLMTAAVTALLRHGFRVLDLNRIEIRAGLRNRRSRAIPERLGFRREGILRQAEWVNGRFVDHAVYGLLASEWRQKGR
ncbi:MAG TPA: GNAT family protein [Holophagaceae bacterium]